MLWFPVLETCTKYPTFNKQSQEAKQSSQLDENAQVSILIATDHSQAVLCRIILSRVQETVQRCVSVCRSLNLNKFPHPALHTVLCAVPVGDCADVLILQQSEV